MWQTVEYLAYQLVLGYQSADSLIVRTLNTYDFYILPIVNPDGRFSIRRTRSFIC